MTKPIYSAYISKLYKIVCLFICIHWYNPALAAATEGLHPLDESKWHELTDDKRYHEKQKPKKINQDLLQKPHEVVAYKVKENDYFNRSLLSPAYTFIIIGLLLLFLLYLLFRNQLRIRNAAVIKHDLDVSIEDLEDNLEHISLENYIKKAIEQNNYRLAIRLQYLNVLKQLSLSGYIKWKKDKTNKNYLSEMSESEVYSSFSYITRFFEQVWYGDAPIDENIYQSYQEMNTHFLFQLKNRKDEK